MRIYPFAIQRYPHYIMNLHLTQEVLMHRIFNNSSSQKCCLDGHLTLLAYFAINDAT